LDIQFQSYEGVELISRYQLLAQLIAAELSPEAASFLAEPVKNLEQGRVSWYTGLPGRIRSLEELSSEEQTAALAYVLWLKEELAVLAADFLKSSSRSRKLAGGILTQILAQDCGRIFLAGGRPILAGWGLTPLAASREEVRPVTLKKAVPAAVPAEPAAELVPAAVQVKGNFSLFRILLGAVLGFCLAVLLIWLFFPKMKQLLADFWDPPHLDAAAFDRNNEEESRLRAELAELKRRYFETLNSCPVPEVPRPPDRPPPAYMPDLKPAEAPQALPDKPPPEPKPAPPPEPKPAPAPPSQPPKSRNLEIPEGAKERNDFSFLEGCWASTSKTMINTRTRRPIVVKYCFDKSGRAKVTVDETDARGRYYQTCSTTAQAGFQGQSLVMTEAEGEYCPKSKSRYKATRMVCTPSGRGGGVKCRLEQPGTRSFDSDFRRM
jgi:hypothetical protein